jgi:hypothetical protein
MIHNFISAKYNSSELIIYMRTLNFLHFSRFHMYYRKNCGKICKKYESLQIKLMSNYLLHNFSISIT